MLPLIVLTLASSALITGSPFLPSTPSLPPQFNLEAISFNQSSGAANGYDLGFQYNGGPHDYGFLGNFTGQYIQPPSVFSFDSTLGRLTYFYAARNGTYVSVARFDDPSTSTLVDFFPSASYANSSGQLTVVGDGLGDDFVVVTTNNGTHTLDPWSLCVELEYGDEPDNWLFYAPEVLPETSCSRVALKIKKV